MKKIFLSFIILATAVACTSEDLEKEPAPMITETISGTYGPVTKATIADADASFKWSVGDNLAIHVSNGDSHKYVFTSGEGGASAAAASASFSVTYDPGYSRDAFAVFPSSIIVSATAANYGQSGSPLDVTLPSSYTLSQVQGEVSPCPMIATNTAGDGWTFYQLCSLLRITVGNIPATAQSLKIDFDGKKVCGNFSIASDVTPGTSVISTVADDNNDVITITNGGSVFGQTSLTLSIPLPVGDYSKITVYAYDGEDNVVSFDNISFSYKAVKTRGVKKTTSLTDQSIFTFTFRDADTQTNLGGLRFVRVFSCQNKLYYGATTFGPYTDSSDTGEADMANPVQATLKFGPDDGDQLAFQVIDASGKVYSGLYDAPTGGFTMGSYDLTVDVKAYTFTVASGKKVYFSPGDLGVNSGVYSFTDPFVNWAGDVTKVTTVPSTRSWFNYDEVDSSGDPATQLYGIQWRIETKVSEEYEWVYIISNRVMNSDVNRYYKLTVNGQANCLLLPPDETVANDIGEDIKNGSVGSDYAKYLAKGFVLLMNAKQGTYNATKKTISWSNSYYAYWCVYENGTNRKQLQWGADANPDVAWPTTQFRLHVRFVRDVPLP